MCAEDGITDALFKFTRPVIGSYFWCPPMAKGRLDLRALGFERNYVDFCRENPNIFLNFLPIFS